MPLPLALTGTAAFKGVLITASAGELPLFLFPVARGVVDVLLILVLAHRIVRRVCWRARRSTTGRVRCTYGQFDTSRFLYQATKVRMTIVFRFVLVWKLSLFLFVLCLFLFSALDGLTWRPPAADVAPAR